jgi:hypothetical protein
MTRARGQIVHVITHAGVAAPAGECRPMQSPRSVTTGVRRALFAVIDVGVVWLARASLVLAHSKATSDVM